MTQFSLSLFSSKESLAPYEQDNARKESKLRRKKYHKDNLMQLSEGCLTCQTKVTPLIRKQVFCNRCGLAIGRRINALPERVQSDKWEILNIIASVAYKELEETSVSKP